MLQPSESVHLKNRMREIRSYGSVRGPGRKARLYSEACRPHWPPQESRPAHETDTATTTRHGPRHHRHAHNRPKTTTAATGFDFGRMRALAKVFAPLALTRTLRGLRPTHSASSGFAAAPLRFTRAGVRVGSRRRAAAGIFTQPRQAARGRAGIRPHRWRGRPGRVA